jgi:hypothetical protein
METNEHVRSGKSAADRDFSIINLDMRSQNLYNASAQKEKRENSSKDGMARGPARR